MRRGGRQTGSLSPAGRRGDGGGVAFVNKNINSSISDTVFDQVSDRRVPFFHHVRWVQNHRFVVGRKNVCKCMQTMTGS